MSHLRSSAVFTLPSTFVIWAADASQSIADACFRPESDLNMVLAELGGRIAQAMRSMTSKTVIDEEAVDNMLKEISSALLSSDVNVKLVSSLRKNVKNRINLEDLATGLNRRRMIQQAVFEELCEMLNPGKKPYQPKKGKPNVIMFVGLQGSGKTTSCTKYALHYQRKSWKTCLVCSDTFRAGAFDQLKQNATKARIPFYGSYTERDPVKIARDGVEMFKKEGQEIIIVDTSGRHKQEASLFEEMQQIAAAVEPDDIVFVLDSSIGQAAHDQAKNSKSCARYDHDEVGWVRSFVSRLLGLGDVGGLMNAIKVILTRRMQGTSFLQPQSHSNDQGVFTLRDMYEQFQNVMKMGPIGKVMSMIPGMSALMTKGREHESQVGNEGIRLQLSDGTFRSDSRKLDTENVNKIFTDTRVFRIAQGSGSHPQQVWELLEEFKRFQKMNPSDCEDETPQDRQERRDAADDKKSPAGDATNGQVSRSENAQADRWHERLTGLYSLVRLVCKVTLDCTQNLMKSMNGMDMSQFMGMPE
eukprot:347985-Hanusia_phi.AAC.4